MSFLYFNYLNVIIFLNLDSANRNIGTPIHVITTNSPNATCPIDKTSGNPYSLFNIQPTISPLKIVGQIDAIKSLVL